MSNGFTVKKRDGSVEKINLDKVHIMVEHAVVVWQVCLSRR